MAVLLFVFFSLGEDVLILPLSSLQVVLEHAGSAASRVSNGILNFPVALDKNCNIASRS